MHLVAHQKLTLDIIKYIISITSLNRYLFTLITLCAMELMQDSIKTKTTKRINVSGVKSVCPDIMKLIKLSIITAFLLSYG